MKLVWALAATKPIKEKNLKELATFLDSHPAADKILLDSLVVLRRMEMSPKQLLSLGNVGTYTQTTENEVELQIGESVIALGKLVEDSGEYYFEVNQVIDKAEDVI